MTSIPKWTIEPLSKPRIEETLTLISEEFSQHSTIHNALGITKDEYHQYLTSTWQKNYANTPVRPLIAVDNTGNSVLGCIISTNFPSQTTNSNLSPPRLQPITALIKELETTYLSRLEKPPGKALLVDLAVVKTTRRGHGIYTGLRRAMHSAAISAGYEHVYGELTSSVTQRVCVEYFGHQIVNEIRFNDFCFSGKKPFQSITAPDSIQLVRYELYNAFFTS